MYMGLVRLGRQKQTAELLVPKPSALEVELAIEKLKSHKSPGIDHIPAELIKAGGGTICCVIQTLIISIWNKEELPGEWKESLIVPIWKKGDKTDCNNYRGISLLPATYKILSNILLSRLTLQRRSTFKCRPSPWTEEFKSPTYSAPAAIRGIDR
jgi:hypothetical protein